MSNGLRQQSVARQAEIKVSCISNILPSVLLCRTLKPNGKFSGNLWVQQRQRTNGTPYCKWICDQLCTVFSKKIIGNVTAKNYLKESLSSILCFIIQGKGSLWKGCCVHGNLT